MGNWSGANIRCPKCNKYMPDRCTCNGPSIEERRAMATEMNVEAERAADLAEFAKWKGYPLPALNGDGNFDKDWLHREWVAFRAGRRRAAQPADVGAMRFPELPEPQHELQSVAKTDAYTAEQMLQYARAAIAHQAAPAQPSAAPKLPEGWIPLSIVYNEDMDHPEEVAYGPPVMMNRLGKWLDKFMAQQIAMRDGMVLAPHYRGYAHLGIGAYILNHSAKGEAAELVISVATEAEKAGRTVGDLQDNAPDAVVQPEAMAVRLRFENVTGLDALEQQLAFVRAVHFPDTAAPTSDQQAGARLDGLVRYTGKEIATIYSFEDEEFFEVADVDRILAAPAAIEQAGAPLGDYAPGQWWMKELEGISILAEPTPDQVRAVAVARKFAATVFAEQAGAQPVAQADQDALDAKRYRWLRAQPFDTWKRIGWNTWGDDPAVFPIRDEDIDSAMAATPVTDQPKQEGQQ